MHRLPRRVNRLPEDKVRYKARYIHCIVVCVVIIFYLLADIMSRATLLYGEQTLLCEYNNHVAEKLNEQSPETMLKSTSSVGFTRGIRQMEEDIKTYDPCDSYLYSDSGSLFNSKKHFYRLISLLLTDLGLVFDIRSPSPWQVISELRNQDIFSETDSAILKICLSIANEIRLKAYFANGGQKERFSPLFQIPDTPEQSADDPIFRDFDEDTLVRLMGTSYDLHLRCHKFCLEYFYRDKVDASMLQKQFFPSKALVRCQLYFRLDKDTKALECLKSIPKDSPEYALCAYYQGLHHESKYEHKEALECFETALEHSQSELDSLYFQRNLAVSLCKNSQFKESRKMLEEAMKLHDEIYGEGSETEIFGDLLLILGALFYELDDMPSAMKTFQRCEQMQKRIRRPDGRSVIYANLYMASSYSILCENDQSLHYMEKALCLSHKVFGKHSLTNGLGGIHDCAAHVYQECGLHHKALSLREHSLKVIESVHGNTPNAGKIVEIKEK